MLVFADLHHFDLYQSLQMLFEKRLGWELYRPIGMEWWHEGFWSVYPHEDTAKQYLGYGNAKSDYKDVHGNPLPENSIVNRNVRNEDGIFYASYPITSFTHRAIRLDKFKEMKFDLIISSMPNHVEPFNKLRQLYQPQAKHIFQVGNNWIFQPDVDGVLSSSLLFRKEDSRHIVYYHQEFPLDESMRVPCPNPKSIVNLMHWARKDTIEFLEGFEQVHPDWTVLIMGAGNRDGTPRNDDTVSSLKDVGFLSHLRKDEGFGFNIHRAIALGRPVVTYVEELSSMTAGLLFERDKDVFDARDPNLFDKLQEAVDNHEEHRIACQAKFDEVVRWNEEEVAIRRFLGDVME